MGGELRKLRRRTQADDEPPQWFLDAVAALEAAVGGAAGGWDYETGVLALQGRDGLRVVRLGEADSARAHLELAERLPLEVRNQLRSVAAG